MAQSAQDLRFAVECPACKAVYSLTADAIGKTAKCRCGHRFSVTGPHFATIPADRAFLCICPHCQAKVVASKDAPRANLICCRCGKTFQKQHTSPPQQPQLVGQPPGLVPSVPLPTNSAKSSTDSIEVGVCSIVAEWQQTSRGSCGIEKPTVSAASTEWTTAVNPVTPASGIVKTTRQNDGWTVLKCPRCCDHVAFVASDARTEVYCPLCSERVLFEAAEASGYQSGGTNPDRRMICMCPRCRKQIAIDESNRGKTIRCPTCSNTFTAPFGEAAVRQPTVSFSPATGSYAYRPLPVRSYRKKDGTWVHSYRRSKPRKRR